MDMERDHKLRELILKRIVQISPFVVMAVLIAVYFIWFRGVTVDDIVSFTPENVLLAILLFMVMYMLKSLSVFFPMAVLNIAAGTIFPMPTAIAVNILGVVVMASVPFFIGRYAQHEFVMSRVKKHKKAEELLELNMENEMFFAFILRSVNCLPIDIVSMLLGSLGFSYKKYIIGSTLGFAPIVILTTILGDAVTDPTSPQFIVCIAMIAAISVTSFIFYIKKIRKRRPHNG